MTDEEDKRKNDCIAVCKWADDFDDLMRWAKLKLIDL